MSNLRSITPLPDANFTPELGNYKTLQPFRYWCQKVLPLVYDDSLSYYELLCKVVDYLNKTMEDVETLHGDVTNLHAAYEELQGYVNNYFSTLDVQEEINNKLDNMANSGVLYEIIRRYTDPIVNEQNEKINVLNSRMNTFTSLPDGSTVGDAELVDIRVGYNGHVYPSAGDAVRGQAKNLNDNKIGSYKLINSADELADFDNAVLNTIYGINYTDILNIPVSEKGVLTTFSYSTKDTVTGGVFQLYVTESSKMYYRVRPFVSVIRWNKWKLAVDNELLNNNLKYYLNSYILINDVSSLDSADNATPNKIYAINTTDIPNMPTNRKGVLITTGYKEIITTPGGGMVQLFISDQNYAYIRSTKFVSGLSWSEWVKINTTDDNDPTQYNGYEISVFNKIICVGDSTTEGAENYNGDSGNNVPIPKYSYPTQLNKITGVMTNNYGKSGYSTKQWYAFYENDNLSGYDSAIIMLGINDPNRGITESESTSYLLKIINKLKNENKRIKIFICSILPTYFYSGGVNYSYYTTICNSMENICETTDDCFFVDMNKYSSLDVTLSNSHPVAIGYNLIAKELKSYISYIIKNNYEKFKDVQFAGTDYEY